MIQFFGVSRRFPTGQSALDGISLEIARGEFCFITGASGAGKTTLLSLLLPEFGRRGLTASTVKHAHHDTDIDQLGRDSHRHREAGAQQVLLAGNIKELGDVDSSGVIDGTIAMGMDVVAGLNGVLDTVGVTK